MFISEKQQHNYWLAWLAAEATCYVEGRTYSAMEMRFGCLQRVY